jgi:hypothetical protein
MMAPDYQTLYQFEPLISATIDCLFNDANVVPKSIRTAPDFQSNRPRVENVIHVGSRFDNHYILDAQGNRRENGWNAQLHLDVITWADPLIHFAYLAAVRELASRLDWIDLTVAPDGWDDQQGKNPFVTLDYHELSQIRTSSTVPMFEPEKGTYQSKLTYDFIFAILPGAWPGGLTSSSN